ncbi:endonuclease/exonuclease/phosphatase family protein [Nocardioides sp.]|uniref:endonuclease/exonuclease/phosphatase family protein n=1 Tax=Nocardioides sp. TaxID=35761 RepID=UPI003564A306
MTGTDEGPGGDDAPRFSPERLSALATVGGVVAIVLVVVAANLLGRLGGDEVVVPPAAASSPEPRRIPADQLATMDAEEIAEAGLEDRGAIAPQRVPTGAQSLARAAEKAAGDQPYSFRLTTFNILGSQHSAPGGAAQRFAPGRIRTEWAANLIGAYGSDIVGFQEIQADQLATMNRATGGRFEFWPGTSMGGRGVPQNLMWRSSVWTATFKGSITIPFMGSTRPQPVVRLQHLATGREIYVMNVHNSPRDRHGREDERDRATEIEIAAIKELRKDGIPVFAIGDFNEHDEIFCRMTSRTDLRAANGGSNSGGCRPPRPMRVDWIFGSSDVVFSRFLMDTGPQVRRITDHAVLSTTVSVP